MSKHNYKQYYNNKPADENKVADVMTVRELVADEVVEPTVTATTVAESAVEMPKIDEPEVVAPVEPITGKVVDCQKLNIRKAASKLADVLVVVPVGTKLTIDLDKSKGDWYSVCTAAGIEGYCMKEFVKR